ncbi:MAG: phage major tail tube protein, partial [Paracoccus sp. (in: a-proteobacteria)]|nr:phage major tail tube protein [Paracoccus sp. (in: a-proteobacteria)]
GQHAALTASVTFEGFDPDLYTGFGIAEGRMLSLTVKGSTQDADGKTHAHAVKMRGFISKLDEGEWKDGESVPLKLDFDLWYYKRERAGVELIEADPVNMIFRVGGVDQLAEHRANIGR